MDTNDPRLVESNKNLTERIKKLDDFIVTVLKYHVSVEQSLAELIEAHGQKAADTFYEKIVQCEGLKPPEVDTATWEVLKKANRLRNAVAHKIDGPEVNDAMVELRAAYAALSAQSAKDEKAMTNVQLAMSAFTHCGSCIIVATENKKRSPSALS
ncbi:hypothetical protein [Bradyrhizobium sp. AZCC 2230]|uniref:hypothetical protein n=1 Tax=Bradyrhizobium sp. AZCC 2230 TaxID=3117021 RepID=UPI002FF36B90